MLKSLIGPIAIVSLLTGCASTPEQQPTSLQVQSFQTREFETTKSIAFGAALSILQDQGYIIESADKDTGFITAASPSQNKTGFWEAMGGFTSHGQTKVTVFVEEIRAGFSTVRLNFVSTKKQSGSWGQQNQVDTPILDANAYQNAFNKLEDAIFIRSGTRN